MNRFVRAMALSVVNQVVTSGTNFVFGAVLVRQLTQEGFGAYGLAFSTLLLALNVGEALFMTPMTVAVARAPESGSANYAFTVFAGGVVVTALMTLPVAVIAAAMFWSSGWEPIGAISAAVAVVSFLFVTKEYLVRICYALRRESHALSVNLVFGVTAVTLAVTPWTRATAPLAAIACYAGASLAAIAVGLVVIRVFRGARVSSPLREVSLLFREGRWYVGSHFAYWLRLQAPTLATTWTLGLSSLGVLNAGRFLVTPPVILNPALGAVALPRLARLAGSDEPRAAAELRRGAFILGCTLATASGLYCAILWLWFEPLSRLMLGRADAVPRAIVAGWCVFVMALAIRNGFEVALKAKQKPKRILAANTVAAIAAVPLCVGGGIWFGELGIVLGGACAEIAVVLLMLTLSRAVASAGTVPADAVREVSP
jgi:O-antigen/teichoic acid export membrane protein